MRKLSIVLALVGLLLGTVLIGWFGAGRVFDGVRRVGWGEKKMNQEFLRSPK